FELVDDAHLPAGVRGHRASLTALGVVYKQLNASVGAFGTATLNASTKAITSNTPGDATYTQTMAALVALGQLRDTIAGRIAAHPENATFHGGPRSDWGTQMDVVPAERLIGYSGRLAE